MSRKAHGFMKTIGTRREVFLGKALKTGHGKKGLTADKLLQKKIGMRDGRPVYAYPSKEKSRLARLQNHLGNRLIPKGTKRFMKCGMPYTTEELKDLAQSNYSKYQKALANIRKCPNLKAMSASRYSRQSRKRTSQLGGSGNMGYLSNHSLPNVGGSLYSSSYANVDNAYNGKI